MLISQYQGVVKIPMFDSGQVFNFAGYPASFANFNFDNVSPMPLLITASVTPSQFTLQRHTSELMSVFGLSKMELNPTVVAVQNTSNVSYIDGYDVFYGLQGATSDPTVYFSTIGIKSHPRPNGNYSTAGMFLSQFTGTRMDTLYQPFPMNNNFQPIIGGFWTDLNFNINQLTISAPSGAVALRAGFSITDGTGNTITNLLSGASVLAARVNGQSPVYDNGFYVSCTGGIHAHGAKYCLWSSFANQFLLDDLSLNNASLNTIFQNPVAGNTNSFAYYGGYIHVLNTGGAGPSGTLFEFVLMSPDFSKWWLINLLPQDANTAAALQRGTNWQLKIDSDGIFWFNSGAVADVNKVYYSYSQIPYSISVPYLGNLQPFTLPCFNVCSPVQQIP